MAVMALFVGSAMGGTLTSSTYTGEDGQEHTKWDVGTYEYGKIPNKQYTNLSNEDFTLDGYDMLGTYDDDGNLVTRYYDCDSAANSTQISPSLKTTGTVTIKDYAQLSLGGLYTDGQWYTGLIANKLIIDAKDDPNRVNFRTTAAKLTDVEIKGGTALFHHAYHFTGSGTEGGTNQGNQAAWGTSFFYGDTNEDGGKIVAISGTYTQSGGNVRFGAANASPHTHSSGTKFYYGQAFKGVITQTGGSMNIYGHTIYEGSSITQSGNGEMYFRDRIHLTKSSVSIQQGGSNTAATDMPKMIIGKLYGNPTAVVLKQTNAGIMTLAYGTNFTKACTVTVDQSGNGTINIGGGHDMKSTDLSGFEAANTTYNFQQTSGTINIANNATVHSNKLALDTNALLNIAGSLTLNDGGTFEIAVNSAHDAAMNLGDNGTFSIAATTQALSLSLHEAVVSDMMDTVESATESGLLTYTIDLISATDKGTLEDLKGKLTWEWEELPQTATLAADTLTTVVTYDYIDSKLIVNDMGDGTYMLQAATNWNVTVTEPIPEPATATLGLLALAGLAARRRRASR